MVIMQTTTATLTVTPITTTNGYTVINMGQTEVVRDTKTILHILNVDDIRQTLNILEQNINEVNIQNDPIVRQLLEAIQAKLTTIEPKERARTKRGLINIVGTAHKWLFGTMDDSDRQEISDHLRVIESNVENSIRNLNAQIEINSSLNESITNLKDIIESDRNQIHKVYNEITENERRIIHHQLKIDQVLKLRMLEDKLNQIIDNVALMKHGLLHPSMLTATELKNTKLDFYGLKNIRVGLLRHNVTSLIFAIKIPSTYELVPYKFITAIPTSQKLEVVIEDQYIVEINGTKYLYENDVQYVKNLELLNNCIMKNNCLMRENKMIELKVLDDSTIICKNALDLDVFNQCDDRILKLNGHYLITINNCSIRILNETFGNSQINFSDKFLYPENIKHNFSKELSFKEIMLKNFVNLEPIKMLKFHKNVQYIAVSSIIVILILVIVVILTLSRRSEKLKISIKDMKNKTQKKDKIQENFKLKEGEVTYPVGYKGIFNLS